MNLKNTSMSIAVALVGFGLLAHASMSESDGDRGRPVAAGTPFHPVDDGVPAIRLAGSTDCETGAPLDWFGPIRPLETCGVRYGLPTQDGEAADVNGDGRLEYFGKLESDDDLIASGGVPVPNRGFIYRVSSGFDGSESRISLSSIVDTQPLAEWILADRGWTGDIYCGFGWNDVDGDGDLDLLVGFTDWPSRRYAWLENTGFEASQPLTGDLNSDGNVNSTDLALLLGGWTGS